MSKDRVQTYVEHSLLEWIDRYVLKRKMEGDRQYSRTTFFEEAILAYKRQIESEEGK